MAVKSGTNTVERLLASGRAHVRRNWQRLLQIRGKIRLTEETFHLILAGIVGVLGGLTNLILYFCIETVQNFALRQAGDITEIAEVLEPVPRLAATTLGGLAAGLVLHWGLKLIKGAVASNLLEVVVTGDGRLSLRTAGIKVISSLISIGTGTSIGREGAVTQLTATLASKLGQLSKWEPYRLRLLVACGAAAGISAAYNAPIAGAVFAAQIVLGNFSMSLFAPLVFSSVVASMVSRSFFGIEASYHVPDFDFTLLRQLPWFLVLGVLTGAVGSGFLRLLHWAEDGFDKLRLPIYSRLALGGFIVGLIALAYPQVWGNGFTATNRILHGIIPADNNALLFVLGLLAAKLLATCASVGSGAVGGVLTPTLFLGAATGSLLGNTLHAVHLAESLPTGAFALVGMGAALSATVHSPLLAMILIFEISLNYSLMPPLMLGCVVATLVARRLHPDSIYTAQLREKEALAARESTAPGAAMQQTVGDLMLDPVPPLADIATMPQIAERFLTSTYNFLPVVDSQQRLCGVVALQDLKEFLNSGDQLTGVIAADVMRPPPQSLTPNQRLHDVLPLLLNSEQRNVPVVNNYKDLKLVGALSRAEALNRLSEAIQLRTPTGT